jgi:hypothetical protein
MGCMCDHGYGRLSVYSSIIMSVSIISLRFRGIYCSGVAADCNVGRGDL